MLRANRPHLCTQVLTAENISGCCKHFQSSRRSGGRGALPWPHLPSLDPHHQSSEQGWDASGGRARSLARAAFLSLGTTHIWVWLLLCGGDCLCSVGPVWHPWLPSTSCQEHLSTPSTDNRRCLQILPNAPWVRNLLQLRTTELASRDMGLQG